MRRGTRWMRTTGFGPSFVLTGLGVWLVSLGCGGGAGPRATAGAQGLDAPDFVIEPRAETLYTVGAFEGEPWETFGQVTDLGFGDDGSLFILDRTAAHIVMIDPAGHYVRTISNKGDGPGELSNPIGLLLLSGDRVAVFDFAKLGFQVFGTDGEFIESIAFDPQTGMPGGRMLATPDDDVVSAGGVRFSLGGASLDEAPGRPVERFGMDGSREVAFTAWGPPPAEDDEVAERSTAGNRMRIQMQRMRAFEPGLHLAVLSDGRLVVVDSVGYQLKLVGPDRAVGETLERSIAPTAVTEEIRQLERERQRDVVAGGTGGGVMISMTGNISRGGGGSVGIDEEVVRQMMEDRLDNIFFFPEIPVISRIGVDDSDRVWVERTGALPGERGPTDVLTPEGRYLGTIAPDGLRIPSAFGPGGLMAYIETDELEVQRVRVARLQGDEALEGAH